MIPLGVSLPESRALLRPHAPLRCCRHEIYEGYKGQRQACPDAVKEAVPRLQALLKAMAIPVIQVRRSTLMHGWLVGAVRLPNTYLRAGGWRQLAAATCNPELTHRSRPKPTCAGAGCGGGRRGRHHGAACSRGASLSRLLLSSALCRRRPGEQQTACQ